jgi:hypothetical protein
MAQTDRTSTAIAMVATSSQRLPDASTIVQAAGAEQPRRGMLGSLFGARKATTPDHAWNDGNLVFGVLGGNLAVSLMPAPIPWSELEGPCATAWWWPAAEQVMRPHKFHFIVALIGGQIDPVERRVILTRVVREVVKGADAVGVYWGEGTLVHDPVKFVQDTASVSGTDIPGPLWIDVRVEPTDSDALRCFTTGLAPLGFHEIEVDKSRLDPGELMGFVGDTACYIVNGRKQIKDGETMGRTANERYKVRFVPSMFDRGLVMRLEMA